MTRETRSINYNVPITVPILLLKRNPFRVSYSIMNQSNADFICVASHQQVNANAVGAEDHNTGERIAVGQHVSDTDDKDDVYAVANNAACRVFVQEVVQPIAGERTPRRRAPRGTRVW